MTTGVITTSFPRHPGDFAGCFVEDAVRACVAAGGRVDVIAAGDSGTGDRPDLGPAVRVLRVAMSNTDTPSRLFFGAGAPEVLEQGGARAWIQAAFFWAALCERIRAPSRSWDRIVAHWLVPCGLAAVAVAPQLPLTAYAHSGDVALLERIPGGAAIGRKLAGHAGDLIFVSADLRDRFVRLTGITVGRVGPAAPMVASATNHDPAFEQAARHAARVALGFGGRFVLGVGRLVPIKGFDILLRAAAIAAATRAEKQPAATVVILGDGPERARLRDMASRLNVDLRLPGLVPRSEVERWMRGADLYVQPSRRLPSGRTEGLPIAALEAIAAGLPVVASATGGLADLAASFPHARVRLVPVDDARALAACLFDWPPCINPLVSGTERRRKSRTSALGA